MAYANVQAATVRPEPSKPRICVARREQKESCFLRGIEATVFQVKRFSGSTGRCFLTWNS